MSFLPEEDQEFLDGNSINYELLIEKSGDGSERRGVLFHAFALNGSLRVQNEGMLVACAACDLLVVIPNGYSTTKLDSFYTFPRLKRPDGADPQAAGGQATIFGKNWQFWSRHLSDQDWRVGVDNLRTYLSYVRGELRSA